jgi:hypothetical protein
VLFKRDVNEDEEASGLKILIIIFILIVERLHISRKKSEAHLNNISEFSPYRKENTTLHHYKDQLVNAVYGNNRCLH